MVMKERACLKSLRATVCYSAMTLAVAVLPLSFDASQSKAQDVLTDESGRFILDTVIISNRNWEEDVQRIPGGVTVIRKDDIDGAIERDLSLVERNSPNVVFQKSNSDTRLVVRGIVSFPNALSDPLGISINDVALPLGSIQTPNLINTESIYLFKGAQGAHYSRNSEAGLLRIENAEPGTDERAWIDAGLGLYDASSLVPLLTGQIGFSKQLTDRLAVTSAIEFQKTDGFITNPLIALEDGGELNRITWQGGVKADVSDRTVLRFDSVFERKDMGKEQFRYLTGPLATGRFASTYNNRSDEERVSSVQSLRLTHEFDSFDFTSISGFTHFMRDFVIDFDTSQLMLGTTTWDLKDSAVSQEFRFNSRNEDPSAAGTVNWSSGLYLAYQDTDSDFNLRGLGVRRQTDIEQLNAALFGFAEYALSDRFRLGAGGRLDYVESQGRQTFSTAILTASYGRNLDFLTFLPKATASFDLNQDTTAYATISRGYLPGGYNYNFANSAATLTFGDERSWTAEVGVRGQTPNGRFQYDVSGYFTDVRDKQITETVPGGIQRISNAARVEIYGAEASVKADLSEGWAARAGFGVQKAEAVDFQTAVGFPVPVPVDFSGNDLPLAPEITYQAGIDYTDPSGFFSGASIRGSSRYFFDAANTLRQPAFAKIDARMGFRFDDVTIEIWGQNLFDEATFTQAVATPRGPLVEDAPPRTFGVRVKAKF